MSDPHLKIVNPSSVLVLDSGALNYHLHSRPAATTAGVRYSDLVTPYEYVVYTGDDTLAPIGVVRPVADRVMEVAGAVALGGGYWRLDVYGASISASNLSLSDAAVAVPDVYIFVPTNSPSSDPCHLRMFKAGVCTFDSGFKPLWLRGSQTSAAVSGTYYAAVGFTDRASWDADAQTVSGYSALGVIGSPYGFSQSMANTTGEPADKWRYGWRLSGSSLQRLRYWIGTDRNTHTFDDVYDEVTWTREATTALLLDLNTL